MYNIIMLSAKMKNLYRLPTSILLESLLYYLYHRKNALEGEIPMVYESSASSRCAAGPKIAAIGGGTGLSTMLRGLKNIQTA